MSTKANTPELDNAVAELRAIGKKYNLHWAFVCTLPTDNRTIHDTFQDSTMFALEGKQIWDFIGDESEIVASLFVLAYKGMFKLDAVIRALAVTNPDYDLWEEVHGCFERKLNRAADNLETSQAAAMWFEGKVDIKQLKMRAANPALIAKLRMITNVLKGRITPDYKAMEESIPAGMSVENLLPKED